MYSDNLSKVLRHELQPTVKFRQFADIKDAAHQGKSKGDTFHWNVYSKIATQGTTLVETSTMPESNFTILQGTLTINEYGNSVPYTQKLDDLSEQPIREIIDKVIKDDAKKAFDIAAEAQFDDCKLRAVATGTLASGDALVFTTDGTATATNGAQRCGATETKEIIDYMKERNITPYQGDDYFALSHPSGWRYLKNELESIHKYVERGLSMIMNGEIGRYESTRFVEQTHIAKSGWSNSGSWAYFFGNDTVAEAIACPEEMRGKIPGDYGRSRGIAWYYLGGFGIVHTDALNTRIVKYDSAA
jgi:N4-gp56 family major capsid protein